VTKKLLKKGDIMKRRGMYSYSSFFKPFIPTEPCSLNRLNNDVPQVYLCDKGRIEPTLSDRNNGRKEDKELFVKASYEA
jgi:hypothetical protein